MNFTDKFRRLSIALLFSTSPVIAQGPPIITETPILLGLEGKAVMLRLSVSEKGRLYQDGREITDSLNRSITETTIPIVIPYNIRTRLLVGAILPLKNVQSRSGSGTSGSYGIGDVGIFAKYLLLQSDGLQETFRIVGKAAVKFPTGDDDSNPPLGSGTFDYSFAAVAAWIGPRLGFYGEASYSVRGSIQGINLGNQYRFNLGVGFRLSPAVYEIYPAAQWNLYAEVLGTHTENDVMNGMTVKNSGGDVVFLSPGLQYIPGRVFLLEVSPQFPIIQTLNGTQLGNTYSLTVGIRWLLY